VRPQAGDTSCTALQAVAHTVSSPSDILIMAIDNDGLCGPGLRR
jgi:hypothetical protein